MHELNRFFLVLQHIYICTIFCTASLNCIIVTLQEQYFCNVSTVGAEV